MNTSGQFFAVDRRIWGDICSVGELNPAISYLILARGTLGDLRTTSWSVNAIEERTSIPRRSAKKAINDLIDKGYVLRKRGGTKPQYFLQPYEAVQAVKTPLPPLTPKQEAVLAFIAAYPDGIVPPLAKGLVAGWPENSPAGTVETLHRRGMVCRLPSGAYAPVEKPAPTSDWIWLPNSIADGVAGETPPLERLRQTHSLCTLRLYIDMYHSQSLSEDNGINWRIIRRSYHKHKLKEYGIFDVYAFWPNKLQGFSDNSLINHFMSGKMEDTNGISRDIGWDKFFLSLELLEISGLIDIIPHAITADSREGTIIHPVAYMGDGEPDERELAAAAHTAGTVMLGLEQTGESYGPEVLLLPVQRHIGKVAVVGLVRLRHRAKTRATASWLERMPEWRGWTERYRAHAAAVRNGEALTAGRATSMGHQREINGTSKGDQR